LSLTVTAWRLADGAGLVAQCLINERDRRWHLIVRRGREVIFSERCPTEDAALSRSTEIWHALVAKGWSEPRH
jgi:hypothetical protein